MRSTKINAESSGRHMQTEGGYSRNFTITDSSLADDNQTSKEQQAYYDSFFNQIRGFASPQHATRSVVFNDNTKPTSPINNSFYMKSAKSSILDTGSFVKSPRASELEKRLDELLTENVKLNQNLNGLIDQKLKSSFLGEEKGEVSKEKYERVIDQLKSKLQDMSKDNEILTKEIIRRGGSNFISKESHRNIVDEKDKKIDHLEKALVEKQLIIHDLRKKIADLLKHQLSHSHYEKKLSEKDAEINALKRNQESMLARLNTSIQSLNELNEEKNSYISPYKRYGTLQNLESPKEEDLFGHIPAHKVFLVIKILQKAAQKFKGLLVKAHRKKFCEVNEIKEVEQVQIARENFKGKFDVVFCVDCTSSMGKYILQAKNACSYIMEEMKNGIERIMKPDLKFGFVGYRDYGGLNGWITKVQDLTDPVACAKFISTITALSGPGNDIPEAVIPGLLDCINKIKWRDNVNEKVLRIVFHIGDAPPHGKIYFKGRDSFPEGDPCKIKISHIAKIFYNMDISYRLIKIGKHCDLMEEEFKKYIKDFYCIALDRPENLENYLSDLLKSQLEQMSKTVSIKDKIFFSRTLKSKELMRSLKAGNCYILSVIFDDYFDLFSQKKSGVLPALKSITLNSINGDLIGIKCTYRLENNIIEGNLRSTNLEPNEAITLTIDDDEFVDEISGELDEYGGISMVVFRTSHGKEIKVGSNGKQKFENIIPKTSKLHAIGGSFGRNGFDSFYVYYSYGA